MLLLSLWITGLTRSGKTTSLVKEFCHWVQKRQKIPLTGHQIQPPAAAALILAANDHNRRELADKLSIALQGTYPVPAKTPLGFISDEVILFWPLLFEQLHLKAQFPLRLRPETEQELATSLWRPQIEQYGLQQAGISEYRFVRQTLDLLQLAGASGIPAEDIPSLLAQGLPETEPLPHERGELILKWRQWCLERGLLSYGIIYELYWRYLLPDPQYQQQLSLRYQAIFADDVDDYPAIARDLGDFLLDRGTFGVFTYNPDGQVRLGLNADPAYLAGLGDRCQTRNLTHRSGLTGEVAEVMVQSLEEPTALLTLPDAVQSLQTSSRADLLRQTADFIVQAVRQGTIKPEEIAIIAPGLDEIARYTFLEILPTNGIPVQPLNEQRPLIASPLVRGLLTLLALAYGGLGNSVRREDVAEMLVVLSRHSGREIPPEGKLSPDIDPVRAGLLADHCYQIDIEHPRLLPVEAFPRWDRLGHRAAKAYQSLLAWLEKEKTRLQQQRFAPPITFLDRAIAHFAGEGRDLPYDQLAALRELMETAQHFWEVEWRLRQHGPSSQPPGAAIGQFIQLLRRGTIAANPRPVNYLGPQPSAAILATIFQYRSRRSFHRWQFWLDAASPLWEAGGAATLLGASLFLRGWSGRPLTPEEELEADRARLGRILRDLLGRAGERVFLCHSDLSVKGTEQVGPLLPLVYASKREFDFRF